MHLINYREITTTAHEAKEEARLTFFFGIIVQPQ